MFGQGELVSLYRTNFIMMHHHGYDIETMENLLPFEREVYTLMLIDLLEKEEQQRQQ